MQRVTLPTRPAQNSIRVAWFNSTKGYGFFQPQGGGQDVFVHISALERAGLRSLNEGQAIEFELVSSRGRTAAENLKQQASLRAAEAICEAAQRPSMRLM